MGQKERVDKIKEIGDMHYGSYNDDRIICIYNSFNDLSDNDFYELCSAVSNKFNKIPLIDDWVACKKSLRLNYKKTINYDCKYCGGSGWLSAIDRETEKDTDAFGNANPIYVSFVCACESGDGIDARRFRNEDRKDYILVMA